MAARGRAALFAVPLALLALGSPDAAEPRHETLAFKTLLGEYRLTFDPSAVPADAMRALALLSPHLAGAAGLAVAPRLELCLVDDPVYLDCGTRSIDAANFAWNARMNLERGAKSLRELSRLPHPAALEPVVRYLTRSLAFSLWLEETKFAYYRSWDPRVLRRRYEHVDPAAACAPVLEAVGAAAREARYHLAAYRWHNCVNDAFRARLGEYPLGAWEAFVAAHGIREEVPDPFEALERRPPPPPGVGGEE